MNAYKIDLSHSEISFKVKHLMITNVSGIFGVFDASMTSSLPDFSDAVIQFSADTASINTNNEQRDAHLRSDDFFSVEQYPQLFFSSAQIIKTGDNSFTMSGTLSIKGIMQTVSLSVTYYGAVTDPYGQEKVGFEVEGKINRKDFGLQWSALTEAGGVVVGDEVKLLMSIQMVKQ
jgi:polyisoprenoid-binding protein YceI